MTCLVSTHFPISSSVPHLYFHMASFLTRFAVVTSQDRLCSPQHVVPDYTPKYTTSLSGHRLVIENSSFRVTLSTHTPIGGACVSGLLLTMLCSVQCSCYETPGVLNLNLSLSPENPLFLGLDLLSHGSFFPFRCGACVPGMHG
jgi:hypothetical protein